MIGTEQRPALGIDVMRVPTVQGDRVLANFWLSRGSGWVRVEDIPQSDGKIVTVGTSEPVRGEFGGAEIVWHMGLLKPSDAKNIVTGYIRDNGYNGNPQVLDRALALMQ